MPVNTEMKYYMQMNMENDPSLLPQLRVTKMLQYLCRRETPDAPCGRGRRAVRCSRWTRGCSEGSCCTIALLMTPHDPCPACKHTHHTQVHENIHITHRRMQVNDVVIRQTHTYTHTCKLYTATTHTHAKPHTHTLANCTQLLSY